VWPWVVVIFSFVWLDRFFADATFSLVSTVDEFLVSRPMHRN